MVSSLAPCSWRASSRLPATPTAPNPATNTVDPSRTPATASAVVFTRLSINSKGPFDRHHYRLQSVAYAETGLVRIDHQHGHQERRKFAYGIFFGPSPER